MKSQMFLFALVLVVIPLNVFCQRVVSGPCPSLPAMPNFEKTKFYGRWIEVEKTPSVFDFIMRCLEIDYLASENGNSDGTNLNVVVRGTSLAGLPLTIKGDGIPQQANKVGKYNVRFGFGVPFQGSEMTVLDTDYKEYVVVYSCTSSIIQGFYHTEYIWLLSRDGTLTNPTRQNIYEHLDRLKINRVGLQLVERTTCPNNSTLITRESEQNLGSPVEPVVFESVSEEKGPQQQQQQSSSPQPELATDSIKIDQ